MRRVVGETWSLVLVLIWVALLLGISGLGIAAQSGEESRFEGTAFEFMSGLAGSDWVVTVDRLISGPQLGNTVSVIVRGVVLPPQAWVDPDIQEGDKVEVYGKIYIDAYTWSYIYLPESYHYIKKIDASANYNLRVQAYDSVTGRMISGAAVYIDSDPTPKGITDSNGEITISIPKGFHTIRASTSGYEESSWSGTIDHDMGIAIGLNPGVVRYRLRVQVYDATTRRMLSGASLFVDQEASPCGMTDASGEATISVSQDVHTIRASKPGYAEGVWNGQIDKDMGIAISLDPAEQRWNTVIRGRIVGEPNYSSSNFNVLIGEVIDDPAHGDNVIVGNTITVYTDSEQLYQLQNGDNMEISATWDTHLYCLPSKYSSDYIKKISGSTSCAAVVVTGEITSEPVHLPFRCFDLRIDEVIKNQNNVPSIAPGQNIFVFFSSALDQTVGSLQAGDCVKISSIWEEAANQHIPGLHCDPESCSDHYIQEIPSASAAEVKFEGTITEPDNMAFDNRRDYTIKVDRIIENKFGIDLSEGDELLAQKWLACEPGGEIIPADWIPEKGDRVEVYGKILKEEATIPGHSYVSFLVDLCGSDSYYLRLRLTTDEEIAKKFMPALWQLQCDIDKGNSIREVDYHVVRDGDKARIEYNVVFNDEDHPNAALDRIWDELRKLIYDIPYGGSTDVETFYLTVDLERYTLAEVVFHYPYRLSCPSKPSDSLEALVGGGTWYMSQGYDSWKPLHYCKIFRGGEIKQEFTRTDGHIDVSVATWNHLFSNSGAKDPPQGCNQWKHFTSRDIKLVSRSREELTGQVLEGIPAFAQNWKPWCAWVSARMVLEYHGYSGVSEDRIGRETYKAAGHEDEWVEEGEPLGLPLNMTNEYCNTIRHLGDDQLLIEPIKTRQKEELLKEIMDAIKHGNPIIIASNGPWLFDYSLIVDRITHPAGSHASVIVGYSFSREGLVRQLPGLGVSPPVIKLHDPATADLGIGTYWLSYDLFFERTVNEKSFLKLWIVKSARGGLGRGKELTITTLSEPGNINADKVILFEQRALYPEWRFCDIDKESRASYTNLRKTLESAGYRIARTTDEFGLALTVDYLNEYDAFVIPPQMSSYYYQNNDELSAIIEYVESGGNLFLLGEWSTGTNVRAVARELGVEFSEWYYLIEDSEQNTGNMRCGEWDNDSFCPYIMGIPSHPITTGVETIYLSMSSYIEELGLATPLIIADSPTCWAENHCGTGSCGRGDKKERPFTVLAYMKYGKGQVVFLADASVFCDSIVNRGDNLQLGLNIIDWLTKGGGPGPVDTAKAPKMWKSYPDGFNFVIEIKGSSLKRAKQYPEVYATRAAKWIVDNYFGLLSQAETFEGLLQQFKVPIPPMAAWTRKGIESGITLHIRQLIVNNIDNFTQQMYIYAMAPPWPAKWWVAGI